MIPKDIIAASKIIIIKIGSALLVEANKGVRKAWLSALAEDVMALKAMDKSVLIVTSGSIALGRGAMGIDHTAPSSSIPLELKQAAAAIGQIGLMQAYIDVFAIYGAGVAQILLTPSDTENRRSHLNARATIQALLEKNIIPVAHGKSTVEGTHTIWVF
jgi:glutamate 5-kinase